MSRSSPEYLVRNEGIVQLSLTASATSLDDVVVIGYGARKKAINKQH